MRNLSLDTTTYDLAVGLDYNLTFTTTDSEFAAQKIGNKLRTFLGEWFLDRDLGIPFYDRILIKQADLNDVNNLFLMAIKSVEEVEEVISFETDFNGSTREYTINFTVKITTGETVEGSVEV